MGVGVTVAASDGGRSRIGVKIYWWWIKIQSPNLTGVYLFLLLVFGGLTIKTKKFIFMFNILSMLIMFKR